MKALADPDNAMDQSIYEFANYGINKLTSIYAPNPSDIGAFTSDGNNEYFNKNRYGYWMYLF